MKVQESVQMYCVKEEMRDGDGKNFKMGFEDWDTIGQGAASLTTIAAVVNQAEGDKYVTSSLVLSFIHTCMKSLTEHGSINDTGNSRVCSANPRCEFPVSSAHESIKVARLSIRQDLQDRWVTNLNEDRKFFFLIASLLDPRIHLSASVTTNTSRHRGNARVEFKSFYSALHDTQVDLLHQDASVHQPSDLSGSTSMDVDVDSVETDLNAYTRVQ